LQINIKDNIDLLESIVRKLEEIALKVTNNEISLEELKKIFCDFLKISI
jgi:DNA-binding transcriptional regulator WhiA